MIPHRASTAGKRAASVDAHSAMPRSSAAWAIKAWAAAWAASSFEANSIDVDRAEVAAERPGDRTSWLSIFASISDRRSRSSRKISSCGAEMGAALGAALGAELGAPLASVLSASVVLSASHSWSRAPSELSSRSRF